MIELGHHAYINVLGIQGNYNFLKLVVSNTGINAFAIIILALKIAFIHFHIF